MSYFVPLLTFISIYYFMMMYAFLRPQLAIRDFSETAEAAVFPALETIQLDDFWAAASEEEVESCTFGPQLLISRCTDA